jgi:hypothetical protein
VNIFQKRPFCAPNSKFQIAILISALALIPHWAHAQTVALPEPLSAKAPSIHIDLSPRENVQTVPAVIFSETSVPAPIPSGTPDPTDFSPTNPYYQVTGTESTASYEETPVNETDLTEAVQESFQPNEAFDDAVAPVSFLGLDPLTIMQAVLWVWDFIQSNKAVVHVDHLNVSALPNASKDNFQVMTGWKPERTLIYHTSAHNPFGMTVIDLVYKIHLVFGGSLHHKGQYIANVNVVPSSIKVAWGYQLEAKAKVISITNERTSDDPLAQIKLDTSYKLSSWIKKSDSVEHYLFRGDGMIQNSATGQILSGPAHR